MIRDITIGRYYDSESVIHRMDPNKTDGSSGLYYFFISCKKCLVVSRMSDCNAGSL